MKKISFYVGKKNIIAFVISSVILVYAIYAFSVNVFYFFADDNPIDLGDALGEVHLGDLDALVDHLGGEAALEVEVLLLLDALKGLGGDERRDGELGVVLGQTGIGVV